MKQMMTAAIVIVLAGVLQAGECLKWNAKNSFNGWKNPVGMTMKLENDLLVLNVTKADPNISNLNVDIAPEDFGALEVDYRATGLPKFSNGEFYYAGPRNGFSEKMVWRHKDLKADGQWHTLRMDSANFPRNPIKECGRITKLRLDLVNQAPGKIEIKEIRLLKVEKPFVWNASNKFSGWQQPVRMTMKQENGLLILDITGADSCMVHLGSRIPAAEYDALEVDYRATGFKEKNLTEFFYANDKQVFSEAQVWRQWGLKADGQWHTLRMDGKKFKMKNWLAAGTISRIRLDMIDSAPGKIEIKEIRLIESQQEPAQE